MTRHVPMTAHQAEEFGIRYEDGWTGPFTRQEAAGAIPNGSTIVKRSSEPGDTRPDGARGVVLGSIDGQLIDPEIVANTGSRFMYFIEWEQSPKAAVAIVDRRIAKLS